MVDGDARKNLVVEAYLDFVHGLKEVDDIMRANVCETCGRSTGGITLGHQNRGQAGLCVCQVAEVSIVVLLTETKDDIQTYELHNPHTDFWLIGDMTVSLRHKAQMTDQRLGALLYLRKYEGDWYADHRSLQAEVSPEPETI